MTRHILYDPATGQVVQSTTGGHPETIAMVTGLAYIESNEILQGEAWVEDGVLHQPPAQPGPHYEWDWASKSWLLTLARAKSFQWEKVKQDREDAEHAGFSWDGSMFDSDEVSQSRIQGGVLMAQLALGAGAPFMEDWTLADNSVRSLSAMDMVNVGMALAAHITGIHAAGRLRRAAIESATTVEQVQAVVW